MHATAPLPDSARRVAELLAALGHDRPIVMLPESGRTSAEAAGGLGCDVAQIAKSIVFRQRDTDQAVVVIASGAFRVDEAKVTAIAGPLAKADARFVKERTGYTIGGVCPLGHNDDTLVLVDAELLRFEVIWAAAGHPHAVFSLTPVQLLAMTGGRQVDVALRQAAA